MPGTDPAAPSAGPVELHSRATAVQGCAPGAACAQVTVRATGQVFTYPGINPATATATSSGSAACSRSSPRCS